MLFEKKAPKKKKGRKKAFKWPEITSPTAGDRADTWDSRYTDPRDVAFYDNERR